MRKKPVYPTWIKPSKIRLFWWLSAGVVVVTIIIGLFWWPGFLLALLATPFVYIAVVITASSHRLSPQGDDVQAQIHDLNRLRFGGGFDSTKG